MASFENFIIEDLLSKLRNVGGWGNMFRRQLRSIFTTPSRPKPTTKPAPRPTKCTGLMYTQVCYKV